MGCDIAAPANVILLAHLDNSAVSESPMGDPYIFSLYLLKWSAFSCKGDVKYNSSGFFSREDTVI